MTNGTFDTDTTGWTSSHATLSVSSNKLRIEADNATGGIVAYTASDISVVSGRRYRLTSDVTITSGNGLQAKVYTSGFAALVGNASAVSSGTGTSTLDFTATTDSVIVSFARISSFSADDDFLVDNVSVRELYPFEQYNPSEGTVVSDHVDVKSGKVIWGAINDDGKSFNDTLYFTSENLVVRSGGSSTASVAQSENSTGKIAGAFKENSIQKASDGVAGIEDTSAALPSKGIDRFTFGVAPWTNGNFICGTLKRISFYDRRLPDETLEALTND